MALRFSSLIFRNFLRCSVKFHKAAPVENASWFPNTGSGGGFGRLRTSGQIYLHFTPVCFIASEAVSEMLVQGKTVETHDSLCHRPASVPPNNVEQMSLLVNHPDQPENAKILKVAIIGAPNAGKSTLSNQILGRKVFAVSKKVHTTRSSAEGVLTEDNTQIVLLDTPGLITPSKAKRYQLEKTLLVDPFDSVQEADLVVVLIDVSEKWSCDKLNTEVLKCLAQNPCIPAVLVLNKVDLLRAKNKLLDVATVLTEGMVNGRRMRVRSWSRSGPETGSRNSKVTADRAETGAQEPTVLSSQTPAGPPRGLPDGSGPQELSKEELRQLESRRGWPHFRDVFMLSALDVEDVEALKRYLVVGAKPGSWQYHSGVLTDQSPQDICTNVVREKLLEYLPQEVPYSVTQVIELWQEKENGQLDILLKLYMQKDSHMKMVIGLGGEIVGRIAREAGEDLANVFLCDVRLKISVHLKK
ncbi:hypothetical protein COCON_G00075370 [Conger conger]|uniref:GTPase Era, mitochondrial n=1 Tax=Conger conger TaxID=82655 RepID=A0A9Q1DNK9_CONCO|nr:GTPase Era, mitochondrial [Conger conger]KAJ8275785.1 hypothetical protein COCON_G00075370 [Conger conger]